MKKFSIKKNNDNEKTSLIDNSEFVNKDSTDTENKNILKSNNKSVINFTVFISVMIMAFGIMFFYPRIKTISNNEKRTPYEDYNLLNSIDHSSFILYKDMVEKQSEDKKTLEDIYIESYSNNYNTDDYREFDSMETAAEALQSRVYNLQSRLNYDFKNLEYAALDKDGNLIINRGLDDITTALSQGESGSESLKDRYGFYIVINYDSNGYPEIKDYYGAGFDYIRSCFKGNNISSHFRENYAGYKVNYNKIKDTTIVYGIPKELKYNDEISKVVAENSGNYVSSDVIMIFGLILGFIALFIGLVMPY